MKRTHAALAVPVLVLSLGACSQIDALAPVGGASITTVRNATYDVLVNEGIDILRAPQCSATSSGFTCTGSTIDGNPIVSEAGPTTPFDLTVRVGDTLLFEGTAEEILEAAVLEAS